MSTRQYHRNQRGFTLAEILVTTAIFAIIMLAALAVYDRSNRVFKTSTEAADMQQSTRIGFDKLVSDVRMAGFDYSRGGIPQQSWQAPQPDEQIEYAGPTAVVFRSNFNYNLGASTGNGLEPTYTPVNVNAQPIFPYVTTSNDEIIAYVLRSTTASANTNSISFYVDDYRPRAAFPSTVQPAPAGSSPSHPEERVTVTGIDTSNNNPPYTLYRVSVSDVRNGSLGTPVAENIRSLNFQYYTDFNGTTLLADPGSPPPPITATRNADGSTLATANTGAIGGDGQYDPNSIGTTTNFTDRSQRALIASMRVSLVGMNASPDLQGYTNPTEPIAAIQKYRQYALSSLVVPRNLGMTGFPEPSYNAPAPPTIVGMCLGHCGAPVIYWTPPAAGGEVVSYHIEWDTNQNGGYTSSIEITDPTATSAILPDDGASDVSLTRYYRMEALNDNGQSPPSQPPWPSIPQNRTRPQAPSALQGTTGQPNQIPLRWTAPTNNETPNNVLSCSGPGTTSTNGTTIPPQEVVKFRVYRGTTANFDPTNAAESVMVLDVPSGSQPPLASPGSVVNWIGGGGTSAYPAANCVDYYYRVQAVDRCYRQATWNLPNDATGANSISNFFPATASAAVGPFRSTATAPPVVPPTANLDTAANANGCPDPQNVTSPNCRATLQWDKTLSDTAGNRIGVDSYVISRAWRLQGVGGAYVADPLFGTAGSLEVNCQTGTCSSGYTQTDPAAKNKFVDFPPFLNSGGLILEYQYTIAAKNCSLYSGNSPNGISEAALPPNPQVDFPGCSTNPTITSQGGTGGSGDSPLSPIVMNAGDNVTTVPNPAPGWTVDNVQYDLITWPQGTAVGLPVPIPAPGPYVFTWSDQIDLQVYQLRITINSHDSASPPNPCQEVRVKYIQDQQAAPCAFSNVTPPNRQVSGHGSNPETDTVTFTVTNNGSENMLAAAIFQGQISITWHSPDLPEHTDLQLTDIVWSTPTQGTPPIPPFSNTDSICAYSVNCTPAGSGSITTTRNIPPLMPAIPPNGTFTFRLSFKFDSRGGRPSLPANPSAITKICLTYKIASEPTVIKKCNLVGQAVTTSNPNSCD